jgi:hypothetical protein
MWSTINSSLSVSELEKMEEKFKSLYKEARKLKVKSSQHHNVSHFVQNVHNVECCV